MPASALLSRPLAPATAQERAAVTALISAPEAPVSGAPAYAPEATPLALLVVLLSPKEPKEPRER
ncbi:hypothetical protein ABZ508_14675 [Streptomyces lavendulocolor]|uniref:Uncharacterized protein n=1 Tax=Streptomyces lavendulocolor TaxID=67316 RepID=A0ABV2W4X8_9ACTN